MVTPFHDFAKSVQVGRHAIAARAIGAVNTIVLRDGAFYGENTDYLGIVAAVREYPFSGRSMYRDEFVKLFCKRFRSFKMSRILVCTKNLQE